MEFTPFSTPDMARLLTLYAQWVRQYGFQAPGAGNIDEFLHAPGDTVLFFADDPRRLPESWDVAVILPDILAAHRPALRVGLLDPHLGRELAAQFGVRIWPSLVFLRDGNYLGALDRMRDWDDYAVQIPDILARSASTPPLAAAASATNSNSKGTLQ